MSDIKAPKRVIPIRFSPTDESWLQEHAVAAFGTQAPVQERRRHARFLINHSVTLMVKQGQYSQPVEGITENISLGGLCVRTPFLLPEHVVVRFVIEVRSAFKHKTIRLKGSGRIMWAEANSASDQFKLAIKCSRPMYRGR